MEIEERRSFADLNVFKYIECYLFYYSVTKALLNRDKGKTNLFFVINIH